MPTQVPGGREDCCQASLFPKLVRLEEKRMQPIRQPASTTVTAFLAVLCLTPALAASDSEIHGVVTDNAGNRSAGPLSKLPWMRRVFPGTTRTTTQRWSAKQTSPWNRESTSIV